MVFLSSWCAGFWQTGCVFGLNRQAQVFADPAIDEFGRRGHHRGFDCVHCGRPKQRSPDENVTRETAFRLGTLQRLQFAETRFQNLSTARHPTSARDFRALTLNADNQFACELSFQVAVTIWLQQWPDRCPSPQSSEGLFVILPFFAVEFAHELPGADARCWSSL